MRKITFDEEELFTIAVFNQDTRKKTIESMAPVLEILDDDPDMKELLVSSYEKLKRITDEDFDGLDLEIYREELNSEDFDDEDFDDENSEESSALIETAQTPDQEDNA